MKSLASLSHFQQKNCAPNMRKIGRLQKWNASHFEQKFSLQLWTILALINLLVQLRVLFNFDTAKEFQLCKNIIELKFGKQNLCWQVIQNKSPFWYWTVAQKLDSQWQKGKRQGCSSSYQYGLSSNFNQIPSTFNHEKHHILSLVKITTALCCYSCN